ncbi:MAG TPA: hypothetical protein VF693_00040 [Allosphingosinicella sp.]
MKRRLGVVALAALLLSASPPADVASPTTAEYAAFVRGRPYARRFAPQPLSAWEGALRAAAVAGGSLESAADATAARFGVPAGAMRDLASLWLVVRARQYDLERGSEETMELRRRLLDLLPRSGRAPVVLQAVAESLYAVDAFNPCPGEDFTALMAGSRDPPGDAWLIANAAPCAENALRAAAAAPGRPMPALVRLADHGQLEAREALPLLQWLTGPQALARIAEPDRPRLSAWLYNRYAKLLFETGLTQRAVALLDGLPNDMRRRALVREPGRLTALVDGVPVEIGYERGDESLKLALAASYALAGRTREAEALFADHGGVAATRRVTGCSLRTDGRADPDCQNIPREVQDRSDVHLLLLDHLLHHPDDDPYLLSEAFLGYFDQSPIGAMTELRCRVFSEAQFAYLCNAARASRLRSILDEREPGENRPAERATLAALPLPGLAEARATIAAELARVVAANGDLAGTIRSEPARTVAAAPAPFEERRLPGAFRGSRPRAVALPRDIGALPEGFVPVRFERSGQRAVMISASHLYDPTAEVSKGAYWLHLSRDGGRHWERPLYTGIADRFPYVVPATSRMPMLNGDGIDLEVEIDEIDTADVGFYSPRPRSRRRAAGLYLHIPFAELARDSDRDGLSDIAAHRLLLDRPRAVGGAPFVVGSDAGPACPAPTPDRLATLAALEQIAERERELRDDARWADRPRFIEGHADDFRCLRTNRRTIVYDERDIAELERFRPKVRMVSIDPFVFNRARDRGHVGWSGHGWGSTFRIRLVGGRWIFERMVSWAS